MAGFNSAGNPVKQAYERAGAGWVAWSQNENYRLNGFLGGFLFNMPSAPMPMPQGYTREVVLEVAGRYADEARAINEHRDPHALADTNIVIILGESFIDLFAWRALNSGRIRSPSPGPSWTRPCPGPCVPWPSAAAPRTWSSR